METLTKQFIHSLNQGQVCLHPTDTSPGLTFDPNCESAYLKLLDIKKRSSDKYYLGLVSSFDQAQQYWQELPTRWKENLRKIWPSPLTIIWKASNKAPSRMISTDGYLGLRYPKLPAHACWFYEVLSHLPYPLPSTSVNISEQQTLSTWDHAVAFCQNKNIYIPPMDQEQKESCKRSTIIKINDKGFELIREGDYSTEDIQSFLS